MTKRIFITGGTGFFGKSMLDYRLRHPDNELGCHLLTGVKDAIKRSCGK